MTEFGKTLRDAREARGCTIAQLAEMTRLKASLIADLENEDFSHIAAPIYGRGFVKLYCEAVGLDHKPLVEEFMAIMNGDRETAIRERAISPEPPAPAEAEPPPFDPINLTQSAEPAEVTAAEPPPPPTEFRLEQETQTLVNNGLPASATSLNDFRDFRDISSCDTTDDPPTAQSDVKPLISRYVTPLRRCVQDATESPFLRLGILGLGALAILAAILFGLRALYRSTGNCSTEPTETLVPTPAQEPASEQQSVPRTAQKIPDLYID